MATDLTEIIRTAAKIKDETVESANTASRVGGCLLDLAAFAAQGIFADEIAFESAADGVSVRLRYHNAQGQPYERRAFIPALNPAAGTAGVLTPAQYTSMKAFGAVYDVGVFTGTATAWAACATAEVAGNSAYRVLKYQIGTVHYYIEQSVRDNFCTQYLFEGQQRFIRTIRFASNDRTQVQNVGAWAKTGAQSISYTPSTRELRIKDFNGEDIGTKATLPEATTGAAGLLSAADKKKLNAYASTFAANPAASTSAAGLMTAADKKKLDDCVTTAATLSKAGLMTPAQVADLDNAMQRAEVGYFSAVETFDEGTNAVLEIQSTTSTAGTVVFCNRIGTSAGASITLAGFAYKVGGKYYAAAPGAYPKPMPARGGIALNTTDGHAYVLTAEGTLEKLLPVATTSQSGLLSAKDKGLLDVCAGAVKYIGSFGSVNAACDYAARAEVAGDKSASLLVFDAVGATGKTIQGRIFQQINGLDECMQIRLWDKRLHRRNVTGANGVEGSQTSAQEWKEFGVTSYAYNADTRKITFSGYDGGELGNVVLPLATSSNSGLMSSAVFSKLNTLSQVSENIHLLNLGTFDTMARGYEAAAALNVCSNPLWESLFFTVGSNSFHIRQQVENDCTVQTLFLGRAIKQRYISFSNPNRTAIAEVQSWQNSMVRNLKYTAASQQIQLQSPWNDNVGSAATIPTVSSSVNGLAPKEWPARLAAIEQRIATLENKVKALEAAAAASTADTAEAGE